jgi:hypothetical protein
LFPSDEGKEDHPTQIIPRYQPIDFSNLAFSADRRWTKLVAVLAAIVLSGTFLFGSGFLLGRHSAPQRTTGASTEEHASAATGGGHIHSVFQDVCAYGPEATKERATLVFEDPAYVAETVAQRSGTADHHWCVFGTPEGSGPWWGVAYAGEKNPVYLAMTAESGDGDHAPRSYLSYKGMPMLRFANHGWVGFVTPTGDDWTQFRAASDVLALSNIIADLNK